MSTNGSVRQRALITGPPSGMGSVAGLAMVEKGASVIITGRDETRGASTVEKIRAGAHDTEFIAADLSEMSEALPTQQARLTDQLELIDQEERAIVARSDRPRPVMRAYSRLRCV